MKQTKKPTRAHKELMAKNKLRPENWRVVRESAEELEVMNANGSRRILSKGHYGKKISMAMIDDTGR